MVVNIGHVYKHFKGNMYLVLLIARHSETDEKMVVYRSMDTGEIYVRPYEMFCSKVDKIKYPNSAQTYRFELVI